MYTVRIEKLRILHISRSQYRSGQRTLLLGGKVRFKAENISTVRACTIRRWLTDLLAIKFENISRPTVQVIPFLVK